MLSTASLKAYNYFYFSLLAVFISFLPVYLSSQGVSTARIGVLLGTGSFIGILSQPLWGMISDKYKTIKKVLGITLGFSLCTGFVLFQSIQFLSLFLFVILMYFFFLPTDPLTESLNYRMAETTGVSFGSIRTFGAAGYASTSLIVGFLSDYFGLGSLAYIFLSYGAITLLICLTLPDAPAAGKPVLLKNLKRFFSEPKTVWFFLFILITAIPHRMNDMFLGIYIQAAGGTPGLVGQAWFYAAVSEVVFFAISSRFLRKGNEIKLISFAAVLYCLRYFACSLAPDPRWIVYLQLLQGCTFVVFYTAAIQYLYAIVPEEWKSTGQTMLAVLFFGVSGIIGSFLGGWIFDAYGGSALYLTMSVLSFFGFLFSFLMRGHHTESRREQE